MRITGTKIILSNEPLPFIFRPSPIPSFLRSFSLKRLSPLETQFESNRRRRRRVTRGFRFVPLLPIVVFPFIVIVRRLR